MTGITDVTAALIGLGGAVIGAAAGLIGAWIVAHQQGRSARAERRADQYVDILIALYALEELLSPLFRDVPDDWSAEAILTKVHNVELARARIAALAGKRLRRRWRDFGSAIEAVTANISAFDLPAVQRRVDALGDRVNSAPESNGALEPDITTELKRLRDEIHKLRAQHNRARKAITAVADAMNRELSR